MLHVHTRFRGKLVAAGLMSALAGLFAPSGHAATTLEYTSFATPGQEDFTTYLFTATSDRGPIVGFNFDQSNGSGLGFRGDFHQIDPFGQQVVTYAPANGLAMAAASLDHRADSHFLFSSADGFVINAAESPSYVGGAFNFYNTASASSSLTFAQLAVRNGTAIDYRGEFTVMTPAGYVLERVGFPALPEPVTPPVLPNPPTPAPEPPVVQPPTPRPPATYSPASVSYEKTPAPGLPGYSTYTFTASTDAGAIVGFNFDGSHGTGFGLFGDFNQVQPDQQSTAMHSSSMDAGYAALGFDMSLDTHFLYDHADGFVINANESSSHLGAAFNFADFDRAAAALPFAQVVARDDVPVDFRGEFTVLTADGGMILQRVGFPPVTEIVPETPGPLFPQPPADPPVVVTPPVVETPPVIELPPIVETPPIVDPYQPQPEVEPPVENPTGPGGEGETPDIIVGDPVLIWPHIDYPIDRWLSWPSIWFDGGQFVPVDGAPTAIIPDASEVAFDPSNDPVSLVYYLRFASTGLEATADDLPIDIDGNAALPTGEVYALSAAQLVAFQTAILFGSSELLTFSSAASDGNNSMPATLDAAQMRSMLQAIGAQLVVPEPTAGSLAGMLLAAAACVTVRRRRHSRAPRLAPRGMASGGQY